MCTPHLTIKDIPMVVVNHTYAEIGLYPKQIVSGGCVVKGTLIKTPSGLAEIQNLSPGSIIMTKYGEKVVSHAWTPETLNEGFVDCLKITFEDGSTVTCSYNHKFLVNGTWVSAENLVVDDDCETL
jgi:hypothetical protein